MQRQERVNKRERVTNGGVFYFYFTEQNRKPFSFFVFIDLLLFTLSCLSHPNTQRRPSAFSLSLRFENTQR